MSLFAPQHMASVMGRATRLPPLSPPPPPPPKGHLYPAHQVILPDFSPTLPLLRLPPPILHTEQSKHQRLEYMLPCPSPPPPPPLSALQWDRHSSLGDQSDSSESKLHGQICLHCPSTIQSAHSLLPHLIPPDIKFSPTSFILSCRHPPAPTDVGISKPNIHACSTSYAATLHPPPQRACPLPARSASYTSPSPPFDPSPHNPAATGLRTAPC